MDKYDMLEGTFKNIVSILGIAPHTVPKREDGVLYINDIVSIMAEKWLTLDEFGKDEVMEVFWNGYENK